MPQDENSIKIGKDASKYRNVANVLKSTDHDGHGGKHSKDSDNHAHTSIDTHSVCVQVHHAVQSKTIGNRYALR